MRIVYLFILCTFTAVSIDCQDHSFQVLNQRLDSIINLGIDSNAFPGAQILVRHKDSIILHKTWGYHTYDSKREVRKDDLYDLASVTKVTSGLPALMKLFGEGRILLDLPVKYYFRTFRKSNKKNFSLRQILSHQSGMIPYIVFWQNALRKNGRYKCKTFKDQSSDKFDIKITDSLFLHKNYHNKMKKQIRKSPVPSVGEYVYSGLTFLLLPSMLENMIGVDYENYLYDSIYAPIGIERMRYKPLRYFAPDEIIPTEYDSFWRKQLVHGTVHDEAAAMLDGVSCNAGLFSSARDLSALFQLYLNQGTWEDRSIISSRAIREFTSYQYENNRRGLGFDKPLKQYNAKQSYIAESASPESFGHSGFTGTLVWADPQYDLVFIFLSNRVYPSRNNRNLYALSLRPRMHQIVYDYIMSKSEQGSQ